MRKWQKTTERYVAFLDIMGFKDRVFRARHDDVLKVMEKLSIYIKSIKSNAKARIKVRRGVTLPVFFSDTILLVSNDDSQESLESIIRSCSWLTWKCLSMGLPIKGAISYGTQTADFNKSIHFGKALIDAYSLQQEVYFYGVVFHDSVELKLKDILTLQYRNECISYDTPFKKVGKIKHYVVDWTIIDELKGMGGNPTCMDIVNELYLTVSGEPRKYVDNTVEFVNSMKLPVTSPNTQGPLFHRKTDQQ